MDIDFIGDDVYPNELHRQIMKIAKELKINVEPVHVLFPCQKETNCEPFPLGSLET